MNYFKRPVLLTLLMNSPLGLDPEAGPLCELPMGALSPLGKACEVPLEPVAGDGGSTGFADDSVLLQQLMMPIVRRWKGKLSVLAATKICPHVTNCELCHTADAMIAFQKE